MHGPKTQLLVPRPKLLRASTVGQKPTKSPVLIGLCGEAAIADLLCHVIEDVVEERVGVDEEEFGIAARELGDEIESVAERN